MADKNFPESFRMEMNKLDDTLTYQKAIKFIEDYATKSGIDIPNRLNIVRTSLSIPNLIQNLSKLTITYRLQSLIVSMSILFLSPIKKSRLSKMFEYKLYHRQ